MEIDIKDFDKLSSDSSQSSKLKELIIIDKSWKRRIILDGTESKTIDANKLSNFKNLNKIILKNCNFSQVKDWYDFYDTDIDWQSGPFLCELEENFESIPYLENLKIASHLIIYDFDELEKYEYLEHVDNLYVCGSTTTSIPPGLDDRLSQIFLKKNISIKSLHIRMFRDSISLLDCFSTDLTSIIIDHAELDNFDCSNFIKYKNLHTFIINDISGEHNGVYMPDIIKSEKFVTIPSLKEVYYDGKEVHDKRLPAATEKDLEIVSRKESENREIKKKNLFNKREVFLSKLSDLEKEIIKVRKLSDQQKKLAKLSIAHKLIRERVEKIEGNLDIEKNKQYQNKQKELIKFLDEIDNNKKFETMNETMKGLEEKLKRNKK